jgi:hypothetical protein
MYAQRSYFPASQEYYPLFRSFPIGNWDSQARRPRGACQIASFVSCPHYGIAMHAKYIQDVLAGNRSQNMLNQYTSSLALHNVDVKAQYSKKKKEEKKPAANRNLRRPSPALCKAHRSSLPVVHKIAA